jgi:hypothetical protein
MHVAIVAAALSFGTLAQAETPREEIAHAYVLLAHADSDYAGHKGVAMKALNEAGKKLGLRMEGEAIEGERQWKSDKKLEEARRILKDAREKLEAADRDRVADRVDKAIQEIDTALQVR